MKRRRCRERGFTMVELLITLAVTMFALIGALALNVTLTRGSGSSNESQEAVAVGKRVLEDLRSKRTPEFLTELTGSATAAPPFDRAGYTALAGRNGMTYTVDVAVAAITATLWRVRVEVRWTDDRGETKLLPLELLRPSLEAM